MSFGFKNLSSDSVKSVITQSYYKEKTKTSEAKQDLFTSVANSSVTDLMTFKNDPSSIDSINLDPTNTAGNNGIADTDAVMIVAQSMLHRFETDEQGRVKAEDIENIGSELDLDGDSFVDSKEFASGLIAADTFKNGKKDHIIDLDESNKFIQKLLDPKKSDMTIKNMKGIYNNVLGSVDQEMMDEVNNTVNKEISSRSSDAIIDSALDQVINSKLDENFWDNSTIKIADVGSKGNYSNTEALSTAAAWLQEFETDENGNAIADKMGSNREGLFIGNSVNVDGNTVADASELLSFMLAADTSGDKILDGDEVNAILDRIEADQANGTTHVFDAVKQIHDSLTLPVTEGEIPPVTEEMITQVQTTAEQKIADKIANMNEAVSAGKQLAQDTAELMELAMDPEFINSGLELDFQYVNWDEENQRYDLGSAIAYSALSNHLLNQTDEDTSNDNSYALSVAKSPEMSAFDINNDGEYDAIESTMISILADNMHLLTVDEHTEGYNGYQEGIYTSGMNNGSASIMESARLANYLSLASEESVNASIKTVGDILKSRGLGLTNLMNYISRYDLANNNTEQLTNVA